MRHEQQFVLPMEKDFFLDKPSLPSLWPPGFCLKRQTNVHFLLLFISWHWQLNKLRDERSEKNWKTKNPILLSSERRESCKKEQKIESLRTWVSKIQVVHGCICLLVYNSIQLKVWCPFCEIMEIHSYIPQSQSGLQLSFSSSISAVSNVPNSIVCQIKYSLLTCLRLTRRRWVDFR